LPSESSLCRVPSLSASVHAFESRLRQLLACKIGGCCGKDTPPLPADEVGSRMASLPLWTLAADGKAISRELVAKNWQAAMSFLNAVSAIAEEEGHHPDLHLTGWRNVRVELSTHAIGGLSMPDMVLAAKIDVRAPGPPSKPRVRSQNPPQSVTTHGAPLLGIAQTIPTVYSPKWLRESGVGAILDAAAGSELKKQRLEEGGEATR
jgi:4a-hydroxytetrahydrobiopterin dehydratase